jgi:mannose-6-phosphate isomerase-like protein (cupin superfamily)
MRRLAAVTALALLVMGSIASNAAPDPEPTCKNCPATYVSREELQEYREWGIASKTIDQQVRALDVGKLNVDVAMVYRGKLDKPAPESVAEHDQVSEVYHIIDGTATLVTGPELVGKKRRPATNDNVRLLNGPGHGAQSIKDGVTHQLKAGDVIVIPAGTGHWFTRIDDHISYLMIRVDPDKVTPLLNASEAKAALALKKSRGTSGQ